VTVTLLSVSSNDRPYAHALGARLRSIRQQQGLSLNQVEERSRGEWKAVVVGSYERGDRAVTVQRLSELADFYGVPVNELLPEPAPSAAGPAPSERMVLDLERLSSVPSERAGPLARYARAIQAQRGDYNGKVLSIRREDLRTLAVIYDEGPSILADTLVAWGVLSPQSRQALDE
jgi:transcriptional regulator with XRE-family HTH domain